MGRGTDWSGTYDGALRSPSKDPDDYRGPQPHIAAPRSVVLRRFAWSVFAIAVLIALYGCVATYFAALPHDPDQVARNEAHARRVFVVGGAALALSVALGLWSAGAYRRGR